ncbi:MAG: OsmC family protein [Deltaproteobacteria bacterium]|nr:OsmC family protein [Deltaproteobacteria bacterium]
MELRVSFPGGKRVDVAFGPHRVCTDQPRGAGGDDSAPAPYDIFLASLGACAGIYAAAFCQARGLDPSLVELVERVTFDPVTHLAQEVDIDVRVAPAFPAKHVAALLRSVDQCKIKKTLACPPRMTINLVPDPPVTIGGAPEA